VHPHVEDLTPFYDDARVFIAPTRYAAGISLKVIEAASRGVPIVCTPLVAQQLGWTNGDELLTAETAAEFTRAITSLYNDADLWTRIRDRALERIVRDYGFRGFRSALQQTLRRSLAGGQGTDRDRRPLSRTVAGESDSPRPKPVPSQP
jgi:glycosyltransferase involved in cell wall biosynthesis